MKRRTIIASVFLLAIAVLLGACFDSVEPPPPDVPGETVQLPPPQPGEPIPPLEPVGQVSPAGGVTGNQNLRGLKKLNDGRVVILPPQIPVQEWDPDSPVKYRFDSGRIALRIEVLDVEVGEQDGNGIDHVVFRVYDNLELDQGDNIYENTDTTPPYCMTPETGQCRENNLDLCCTPWFFTLQQQRWPNGKNMVDGDYRLDAEIIPEQGQPATWHWRFSIEGAMQPTPTLTPTPTPRY